jgi:hypothetical protein
MSSTPWRDVLFIYHNDELPSYRRYIGVASVRLGLTTQALNGDMEGWRLKKATGELSILGC